MEFRFMEVQCCALKIVCVSMYMWVYLCLCERTLDRETWQWLTLATHFSLQQRMHPPQIPPLSLPSLALFISFPLFLCFRAPLVTTSSSVG